MSLRLPYTAYGIILLTVHVLLFRSKNRYIRLERESFVETEIGGVAEREYDNKNYRSVQQRHNYCKVAFFENLFYHKFLPALSPLLNLLRRKLLSSTSTIIIRLITLPTPYILLENLV